MGTLYVVGTPIGNLEDLGLRALRILGQVPLVLAEDTRQTRRLLTRHGVHVRVESCHAHTSPARRADLVAALCAGADAALVTDAGTPGISDPGVELVREAAAAGVTVVPIPGASAVATALSAAGMPADAYTFLGFLPRQRAARRRALAALRDQPFTLVVFEAPHRLCATLADIHAELGDRAVAVCRELTKLHEEIWRGTVLGALAEWTAREPRGEYTLVIAAAAAEAVTWTEDAVRSALEQARAEGLGARTAAGAVAVRSGWSKRDVYRLWAHAP